MAALRVRITPHRHLISQCDFAPSSRFLRRFGQHFVSRVLPEKGVALSDEDELALQEMREFFDRLQRASALLKIEAEQPLLDALQARKSALSSEPAPTREEEMEIRTEIGQLVPNWQSLRRRIRASPTLSHLAKKLGMDAKDLSDHVAFARLPALVAEQYVEENLTWPMIRERMKGITNGQLECELGADPV